MRVLLKHGAAVDKVALLRAPRAEGWGTALHVAASNAQERSVHFLLQHGASVASRDNRGRTPLQLAVAAAGPYGRSSDLFTRVVSSLLERGFGEVDVDTTDNVRSNVLLVLSRVCVPSIQAFTDGACVFFFFVAQSTATSCCRLHRML